MKEIDWSKAPEGYDFALSPAADWNGAPELKGSVRFASRNGLGCFKDDTGMYPQIGRSSWEVIAERPVSWTGDGLPPVGTVCELRNVSAGTCWAKAHIKFASRNVVVWDWDGEPAMNGLCTAYLHALEIRPTRTPEQIAAEEREKAVSQMAVIALAGDNQLVTKVYLERLYDAGYRRVEQ